MNCLVRKYKGVSDNNSLLKFGEVVIDGYANKVLYIIWNNFDGTKCAVRVISGSATIENYTNGYKVTTGAQGALIGATEKYSIKNITSDTDITSYAINLEDMKYHDSSDLSLSKMKGVGDITPFTLKGYNQNLDLSEAYGLFDLSKVSHISMSNAGSSTTEVAPVCNNANTTLVSLTSQVFFKFDSSNPLPISKFAGANSLQKLQLYGANVTGNISDIVAKASFKSIGLENCANLTGVAEPFIIAVNTAGNATNFILDITGTLVTWNGGTAPSSSIYCDFSDSTKIVCHNNGSAGGAVIGTYTKATGTWEYA